MGPPSLRRTLKVVFAETPRDRTYLEACLDKPLPIVKGAVSFRTSVDATNARPSTFPTSRDLGVLHYTPPASVAEWPHITVTISGMNIADLQLMRGRYCWLAAPDEAGAVAQLSQIASQAGLAGMPLLRVLSPRDTANA